MALTPFFIFRLNGGCHVADEMIDISLGDRGDVHTVYKFCGFRIFGLQDFTASGF